LSRARRAYARSTREFFSWCEQSALPLAGIRPLHVATYIELLKRTHSAPTVKQTLAVIRMLFVWLVTGQVIPSNPADSLKGPKNVVSRGKTPILLREDDRLLIESIPLVRPDGSPDLVGLRELALIGTLFYSFACIGATLAMQVEDFLPNGKRWHLCLHEKGGKYHEMLVRHTLLEHLDAYLEAAGIADQKRTPLFRSAPHRSGQLTNLPMRQSDAHAMIQRRARQAGTSGTINNHNWRTMGITAYLENGGILEHAQQMAAHSSPHTTKLYDRTSDDITLDEVKRIRL
jgi:site-specific recombinase XerD